MPLYDYRCECGVEATDVFRTMRNESPELCPKCGRAMEKVPVLPHTDLKEYHQPIEMFSIAMEDPQEIADFARKCPDVEISMDPTDENYGLPIAKNRKGKLQALKAAGFTESNSERVRG